MKLIIEADGQRRLINKPFRVYGDSQSLKKVRDCIDAALAKGLSVGWVELTDQIAAPDTTLYPWEPTAEEKPVVAWSPKVVRYAVLDTQGDRGQTFQDR